MITRFRKSYISILLIFIIIFMASTASAASAGGTPFLSRLAGMLLPGSEKAAPHKAPAAAPLSGEASAALSQEAVPAGDLTYSRLVAHAAGAYMGITYTNSITALDANYSKGFRLFEMDFNLTSDQHIVLMHDWGNTAKRLTGTGGQACTYKVFKSLRAVDNVELADDASLAAWLKKHPDAYIVTDCKVKNLDILRTLSSRYPLMRKQLLPQMGPFDDYAKLQRMGYDKIILATYRTNYTDDEILKFVQSHKLYAVSMWAKRAQTSLPLKLRSLNVKVYAHTVNSLATYGFLLSNGVYGIYTDSIAPI